MAAAGAPCRVGELIQTGSALDLVPVLRGVGAHKRQKRGLDKPTQFLYFDLAFAVDKKRVVRTGLQARFARLGLHKDLLVAADGDVDGSGHGGLSLSTGIRPGRLVTGIAQVVAHQLRARQLLLPCQQALFDTE